MDRGIVIGICFVLIGLWVLYPKIREYMGYESQSNLWTAQILEDYEWYLKEKIKISSGARLVLDGKHLANSKDKREVVFDVESCHPDFSTIGSMEIGDAILFDFQSEPIIGVKDNKPSAYLRFFNVPVDLLG